MGTPKPRGASPCWRMSSLAAIRNTARSAVVNAAMRMAPRAAAGASLQAAPALWARSFASGGFLPKEEVSSRVLDVVKNFQNVDPAKVTATSHFINDLGLDSLHTVEQAVNYIASHSQAK